MFNQNVHDFCSEFYLIEKVIEIVVSIQGTKRIRIEALKNGNSHKYSVQSYVQDYIRVNGEDVLTWVNFELPYVIRDTADQAINQALDFLSEKC